MAPTTTTTKEQEPKKKKKEEEEKPLGTVWISCPQQQQQHRQRPLLWLHKVLESAAEAVYRLNRSTQKLLQEAEEAEEEGRGAPSSIVLCANEEEDIAMEVRRLRELAPEEAPILVFGPNIDARLARTAVRAGARGFIHAKMKPKHIVRALKVASEGELALPRALLEDFLGEPEEKREVDLAVLKTRQQKMLELVAQGCTNAQIAKHLFLSESSVKQHLSAAFKVLGVSNRYEAARLVRANTTTTRRED